jgi:hypothetical protein
MDKKQTAIVLEVLSSTYLNRFKVEDPRLMLEIWSTSLEAYDYNKVTKIVADLIKVRTYPPTIADIIIEYSNSSTNSLTLNNLTEYDLCRMGEE